MKRIHSLLAPVLAAAIFFTGCASTPAEKPQNDTHETVESAGQESADNTPGAPHLSFPEDPQLAAAASYVPIDDSPALLDGAKWIWADTADKNAWVDFRKTFTLERVPHEALAEIAVENTYFLWVNGELVVYDGGLKRGPNREEGYFDRVDLAPYLKAGENEIAVKAWFWGPKSEDAQSYSNIPVDKAGFLFALDAGEAKIVSDSSWKALRDDAFKDDTLPGYDVAQPNLRFPEYNIYYDANDRADGGFPSAGYDDTGWSGAQERGSYGDAPYNTLRLRNIPLIREYGLTDYLNSSDYEGYTTSAPEEITVNLPYNAQFAPYLKVSTGEKAAITIKTDNTESAESVWTTYVTSPDGEQEFESPAWISGQFVTYVIPANVTILSLKYRQSGYAADMSGSFSMGDSFYDSLWEMAARTQYVCIRENFMDCPDRERAQWTGDGIIQMRQMMYMLSPESYDLYRKMIQQKSGMIDSSGKFKDLLLTVTPIYNELYELPAQEMAGIVGLWDYYLYTGDASVLYEMYEPALRYLKKWNISDEGLVKHKTGQGLVDWQDTGSNKVDTKISENAWYFWCLDTLRKIGRVIGQDTSWQEETMAPLYYAYQNFWVDGVGYTTGDTADDRGNALAVLSGLAPQDKYDTILSALKTQRMASSYMEAYVLRAMCEMGAVSEALDRMAERFGPMVEDNLATGYTTLWEYFEKIGTLNHAWSGSPAYILSRFVGGVEPTMPGYTAYVIAPEFSHSDSVTVSVDSVIGMIRAEAEKTATGAKATVTIPAGGTATVKLPAAAGNITVNGAEAAAAFENGTVSVELTEAGTYTIVAE